MLKHIAEEYEKLTPGIGTDVFIRKKAPGSQVGEGYIIDIYQNGVKTDSMEKNTKRETIELIQSFKDLYNTNRAFQNELQVHITYKTKEERGETAMLSIDQTLLKQASDIQNLLSRILDPEIPVVVRTAADPVDLATQPAPSATAEQSGLGNVTSVPSTPAPEGMQDNKAKIKKFMADEIVKKFTTFVKKRYDEGRAEVDEIFNPLRSWYSKLKKEIERWNQMSEEKLSKEDITDVVKETSKILLSKDVNIISKATGIQIDQNVADLISQVSGRSVGKPGEAEKGGEMGGNPEESQKKESTYKVGTGNIEEELYNFERQLQNSPTNPIPTLAKELGLDSKDKVEQLNEILSKKSNLTESQTAIKTWVEEEIQADKKAEDKSKEFWKYASNFVGVADIDDVFFEWLGNSESLSLVEVEHIWNKISSDIDEIYKVVTAAPVNIMGTLQISAFGQSPLLAGKIDWSKANNGLVFESNTQEAIAESVLNNALRSTWGYCKSMQDASAQTMEFLNSLETDTTVINQFLNETIPSDALGEVSVTVSVNATPNGTEISRDTFTLARTESGQPFVLKQTAPTQVEDKDMFAIE